MTRSDFLLVFKPRTSTSASDSHWGRRTLSAPEDIVLISKGIQGPWYLETDHGRLDGWTNQQRRLTCPRIFKETARRRVTKEFLLLRLRFCTVPAKVVVSVCELGRGRSTPQGSLLTKHLSTTLVQSWFHTPSSSFSSSSELDIFSFVDRRMRNVCGQILVGDSGQQ
jgi:hypothetical protein